MRRGILFLLIDNLQKRIGNVAYKRIIHIYEHEEIVLQKHHSTPRRAYGGVCIPKNTGSWRNLDSY